MSLLLVILLLYSVTLPMQAPDVSGLLVEMMAQGGRKEATGQVRREGGPVWGRGESTAGTWHPLGRRDR